ncbi:MAG: DUF5696 domain-containing protein [Planctomycetota bacterium]
MLSDRTMSGWYLEIGLYLLSVLIFPALIQNTPAYSQSTESSLLLENDTLRVEVETRSGCFTVTEKVTGQKWRPDPWEHAAALLTLRRPDGAEETVNLSKSRAVEVKRAGDNTISIQFIDPILENSKTASGVRINTRIILEAAQATVRAEVVSVKKPAAYTLTELRFPARHFSLRTDIDRGAGVIPQWQGVICPSYIFPMTGGRFCQWDDSVYDTRSVGTLDVYNFQGGLSMPWFGTHTEQSAVVGILAKDPGAKMEYIINNNGQHLWSPKGKMSPYPRILTLTPVWDLKRRRQDRYIQYHFIPNGNHVQMAKQYRAVAKERGYFVSLKEKAEKNPDVNKLAGAIYLGVYGGYPHYVNMPGMAFTFDQLNDIIKDLHDNLKVAKAFVHAWGTFSNYVPNNWPISADLGGAAKLKAAVDRAKECGYLYSSYHAYSPRLEHDPDFDTDLLPRNANGGLVIHGRWGRVDSKHFYDLAKKNMPKEIKLLGQNADIADILFIGTPDEGRIKLAKYLRSLDLVLGTERGQEHYIPYFDMFEGMTYYYTVERGIPLATISHHAPLFNLVYHDAIANFGKIQDPDNDVTSQGDFRIKSLENILHGTGTLIFFAPYEYPGMRNMIRLAANLVAPVHEKTFFTELIDHEFLSPDFKLQRSRFSNGVEVTVNLGPVEHALPDGTPVGRYGFRIKQADGQIVAGQFQDLAITKEKTTPAAAASVDPGHGR